MVASDASSFGSKHGPALIEQFFAGASMPDIPLQINIAQGAPPIDFSKPLRPANAVTVFGSPNTPILASVGVGAGIAESGYAKTYQFPLDATGYGRFNVAAIDLTLLETNVVAQNTNNASNMAGGPASFGRYRVGDGSFYGGYAWTTHGAADGTSVCSAYVNISPLQIDIGTLTKVVAKVDRNAWLTTKPGKPQLDFIPLDQGTATIAVADATPELVHLTLALPESPDGEFLKLKVGFVEFPPSQPQFIAAKSTRASASMRMLQRMARG
jgi:hypothetical protein